VKERDAECPFASRRGQPNAANFATWFQHWARGLHWSGRPADREQSSSEPGWFQLSLAEPSRERSGRATHTPAPDSPRAHNDSKQQQQKQRHGQRAAGRRPLARGGRRSSGGSGGAQEEAWGRGSGSKKGVLPAPRASWPDANKPKGESTRKDSEQRRGVRRASQPIKRLLRAAN